MLLVLVLPSASMPATVAVFLGAPQSWKEKDRKGRGSCLHLPQHLCFSCEHLHLLWCHRLCRASKRHRTSSELKEVELGKRHAWKEIHRAITREGSKTERRGTCKIGSCLAQFWESLSSSGPHEIMRKERGVLRACISSVAGMGWWGVSPRSLFLFISATRLPSWAVQMLGAHRQAGELNKGKRQSV